MDARSSASTPAAARIRRQVPPRAARWRSLRRGAHLLGLGTPIALGAPALFWVIDATRRLRHATLGRDQGIFQYIAWAVARGAVDYRDVHDVNGPFTHLWHRVLLALGGADEVRFRTLDLVVTGLSFAIAGACMAPARARAGCGRPRWSARLAWAGCGWVVLSAQYLRYDFWDTAQRESFFDCLLVPSLALQFAYARGGAAASSLVVSGALSAMPCFGKPTYALFTVVQLASLWGGGGGRPGAARRAARFVAGAILGAAVPLAFLFSSGDAAAFSRITFVDVPTMYRFIWSRSAVDILSILSYPTDVAIAVGAGALIALIRLGELPAGALPIAVLPLVALFGVAIQGKGFPYHFHPVTAGVALQLLVLASWASTWLRASRRFGGRRPPPRVAIARARPVVAALLAGVGVAFAIQDSPFLHDRWLLWAAERSDARLEAADYAHFTRVDFFPDEMRRAAAFLEHATAADDVVQVYGMDPYLLFLARRLSATPYIYAYDLNVDAALAGGMGSAPDAAQAATIRRSRDRHEADLLDRVARHPPAAWVFIDASPLLSESNAWDDFNAHCPRAAAWVEGRYRFAADFGHYHVATTRPPAIGDAGRSGE